MKRVATAAIAGVVVMLASMIGFAPAHAAEGYGVDVTINSVVKFEGEKYKVSASASPDVDCDWTLKVGNKTVTEEDGGSSISHTFTAQQVSHDTTLDSKATCKYSGTDPAFPIPEALGFKGGALRLATAVAPPVHTAADSGTVLILDRGGKKGDKDDDDHHKKKNKDDDDDNGNLPNTGGERLAWLVIGLLLVAAGTTVVVSSRKRDSVA